jgi:hypothetical protein
MDDATTLSAEDVLRGFLDDLSRRWRCAQRQGFMIVALKPPP